VKLHSWNAEAHNLRYADFSGALDLSDSNFNLSWLDSARFTQANLTRAAFSYATLTNADVTFADTRGAQSLDLSGAISRNAILPDRTIATLDLAAGDRLLVRDDDGMSDPPPTIWLTPRQPIAVTIRDHLNMGEGGVLELLFDADPWDSLISFQSIIPVQFGGTLEFTFADDVEVATHIGRTFHIFDWTGAEPTGAFAVASQYPWDVSQLYTTGGVWLLLPGDTNSDGIVDIIDLNNVRNYFGISAPHAVPEPRTLQLTIGISLGLVALALRQRREF